MFCYDCAARLIAGWQGWPGRDELPRIPKLTNGACPSCGGTSPLCPEHILYANIHSAYSTGLPDYFVLVICPPGDHSRDFLRRWGLPYIQGPPRDCRIPPGPSVRSKRSLPDAAWDGSLPLVRQLVENGAAPNELELGGRTALHYACRKGYKEMAFFLIDRGADVTIVDEDNNTPLHEAVSATRYDFDLVHILIQHGAHLNVARRDGWTPLMLASLWGRDDAVALLLDCGADPGRLNASNSSALDLALERVDRGDSYTRIVRLLVDRMDKTVAYWNAVVGGKVGVVELLLQYIDLNAQDALGRTALSQPAEQNRTSLLRLLLDRGADPNVPAQDGQTALMAAATNGNFKSARLLLRRKARVDAQDGHGRTALMLAARAGTRHMVRLFLNHGADRSIVDDSGGSAIAYGLLNPDPAVRALLSSDSP